MTRKELESVHPDYAAFINEWRFFVRSYFGGKMYKDGDYLIQHPFESVTNYNRRREISYFYNYCAPIVDIFVSHLFRQKAKRDYGSLNKDPLFNAFLTDADLEGSSFRQFMREAARLASIYGRVSVIVDRPKLYTSTVAEAESFGIRPYLSLVTPENLLDWTLKRDLTGRPLLEEIKIKEANGAYKIWNLERWEYWQVDADTNEPKLIDSGEHNLGAVPVVTLYNKRSGRHMLGISDIQDIADINKNIYYLCSDAKEIIENTAFPMLALPYEKGARDEERQIGPRNILQFDPSEANSKPYWLEPPHSSLTEIREWVKQDITEIHRIAKMGGVKATEDFAQARSGVAIELEYQQLHAVLSEKGDNLEEAETRIMELWANWQGKAFDGCIDYPDDFSVRDLDRDLERSIKAVGIDISSATFKRELQKKVVTSTLPKIDDKVRAVIDSEIDAG